MTKTTEAPQQDSSHLYPENRVPDAGVAALAGERIVSADFVLATLANFFNSFGSQMLFATLPVYVLTLGGTNADAGLVSGALAFTALLLRPLVGWLTDAWMRRPLVLIGTGGYGLAALVYTLAGTVPALLVGRVIHGFGLCCYTTASNAYLADIVPPRRRAEGIGLFAAAQSLGLITGPAAGFFIIAALGFDRMFYLSAALALVAFVVSLFARERRKRPEAGSRSWSPRTGIVAIEALPVVWTALCLGMGFGPVLAFVSIFATSRGIENPGFYFTVQAIALLLARAICGRVADRHGRAFTMIPGTVAMSLGLAVLPLAQDFSGFAVSAALFGLGFGTVQPASMALIVDMVRPEQRGLGMSSYFTGFDGGIAIGSFGLGVVSEHWGFGAMWLISAACTLLGLLGLLFGRHHKAPLPG